MIFYHALNNYVVKLHRRPRWKRILRLPKTVYEYKKYLGINLWSAIKLA